MTLIKRIEKLEALSAGEQQQTQRLLDLRKQPKELHIRRSVEYYKGFPYHSAWIRKQSGHQNPYWDAFDRSMERRLADELRKRGMSAAEIDDILHHRVTTLEESARRRENRQTELGETDRDSGRQAVPPGKPATSSAPPLEKRPTPAELAFRQLEHDRLNPQPAAASGNMGSGANFWQRSKKWERFNQALQGASRPSSPAKTLARRSPVVPMPSA